MTQSRRFSSGSMVLAGLTSFQIEDITRVTQRPTAMPTTAVPNSFSTLRIQEVVLAMFTRFSCRSMDLEALIFFTLREFYVTSDTYEHMYKLIRTHVLKNFAIQQGAPLRLTDVSMRRINVCHTIDAHEDD